MADDLKKQHRQYRQGHKEDHRQGTVDKKRQAQSQHHHKRRSAGRTHACRNRVLDRGHIPGQSRDQRRNPKMIHVSERKFLELLVFRLPQLRSQALAADSRKPGACDTDGQRCQRTEHHQGSPLKNIGLIAVCHTHIHHICHDKRHNELKKGLRHNTDSRQNPVFFIRSDVRKYPSDHLNSFLLFFKKESATAR